MDTTCDGALIRTAAMAMNLLGGDMSIGGDYCSSSWPVMISTQRP